MNIFVSPEAVATMALIVLVYWLLPKRFQLEFLALCTAALLVWLDAASAALLAVLGAAAWFGVQASRARGDALPAKLAFGAIVLAFIGYKWAIRPGSVHALDWVLLGASFYVLRMLHYLIEHMKGTLPAHGARQWLGYLLFLPAIPVGPINRFNDFVRDDLRRRFDLRNFTAGAQRILYGFVKIIVIADHLIGVRLARAIELVEPDHPALAAWLHCLHYGADLYFRFSGATDLVLGAALLLGFRLIENFNWPFAARNIGDFWQRWHISLSRWCRDYVYTPAAAIWRRPRAAVILSMVVLGLWHELSPRYLAWGAYHGVGIAIWQSWDKTHWGVPASWRSQVPGWIATGLGIALTFNFVVLSFAITRSETLAGAWQTYRVIFGGLLP